ncbi:MAG: hypothetical protein QQN63_00220 [Nitrosopumilus sp.]
MNKEEVRVFKAPPLFDGEVSQEELLSILEKEQVPDLEDYDWQAENRGWQGWYVIGTYNPEPVLELEDLPFMYQYHYSPNDSGVVLVANSEEEADDKAYSHFSDTPNFNSHELHLITMSPLSEIMEIS